jgi:hypothetical protein
MAQPVTAGQHVIVRLEQYVPLGACKQCAEGAVSPLACSKCDAERFTQ